MTNESNSSHDQAANAENPEATVRAKNRSMGGSVGKWAVLLVVVVSCLFGFYVWYSRPSDDQLIDEAHAAYNAGEHQRVLDIAAVLIGRKTSAAGVLVKAAKSAEELKQHQQALDFLNLIDDQQGINSLEARTMSGKIAYDMGRAKDAEQYFRAALQIAPSAEEPNHELAKLLNILGRRYEADAILFELLKLGKIRMGELILLGNRQPNHEAPNMYPIFEEAVPADPRYRLNQGRALVLEERPGEAVPILQQIVTADETNVESQVWLGKALWAARDDRGFSDWHAALPEQVKEHPEYWLALGLWASDHNQPEAAMRCFWETLRRDPDIAVANFRLAKLIERRGEAQAEMAQRLEDRSHSRIELEKSLMAISAMHDMIQKPADGGSSRAIIMAQRSDTLLLEKDLKLIASTLQEYGRLWEAFAWYQQALQIDASFEWAAKQRDQLMTQLNPSMPRYVAEFMPVLKLDFQDYPLPTIQVESAGSGDRSVQIAGLKFVDEAERAGINFQFFNAPSGDRKCLYMYQVVGGGIGVLDFNQDGLPDFYAVQAGAWPIDAAQTKYLDQLYQNMGDGSFREVSAKAHVVQNGYGQSVTVGDYNADGFPDLYVANIYDNRLLCNNGDGTFSDVTADAQLHSDAWTAGCAMADLDGDLLPDLYDVNYLVDEDIFTRTCPNDAGLQGSCGPRLFDAAQDQVWLNQGDGTFRDVTADVKLPKGKGLGIVVGDINQDHKLDVFVANDGEANFCFINESIPGKIAFQESAALLGVDYDSSGNPQACMGVAVADVNKDQKIDLFVTNFMDEWNSLYLSDEIGFVESSRQSNLVSAGYDYVGFGTQFLDAELDGDDDLLIINGHVQDYVDHGRQPEMPPLLLVNRGDGRFDSAGGDEVGSFFQERYLGRGMARLDWNRDGLNDLLVSSLDRPLVLLTNHSAASGGFISLRLVGTASNRDAIGTSVVVHRGNQNAYQQLTAGDGFAASNQRELIFATGNDSVVERIEIEWPNGEKQVFPAVEANRHYVAVEGQGGLVPTN